ncbi:hypothetical protein [Terrisporobacter hibernicus]|uniref:Uncharacterized protein n=1 Tax=Terrisporobacter hibernicus TaxID=2813371 RepID=A0AAX2ZHM0_9FIRM|nr:hypothetical protein [Terrisporobacter hibernicus]UEL48295.1 hypothetical protein JW646_02245 [Terrisporobacter hibernicus]
MILKKFKKLNETNSILHSQIINVKKKMKDEIDKERVVRSETIRSINGILTRSIDKNMEVIHIYEKENKIFVIVIINESDDIKMYTYMVYSQESCKDVDWVSKLEGNYIKEDKDLKNSTYDTVFIDAIDTNEFYKLKRHASILLGQLEQYLISKGFKGKIKGEVDRFAPTLYIGGEERKLDNFYVKNSFNIKNGYFIKEINTK